MKDEEEIVNDEVVETPAFQVRVVSENDDVQNNDFQNQNDDNQSNNDNSNDNSDLDNSNDDNQNDNSDDNQNNDDSQNQQQLVVDESLVLNFLKEKGFNAETLEDLKPKEIKALNAKAEAFQKYIEETNNDSLEDFLALQKDWSAEPKENVLKTLMKAERPYLNDSDIELLLEDKYAIEELDEYASDSEKRANRLKEIALEEDYQKGLKLLESQKEKYMVRKGLEESVPEEYKEAKVLVDNFKKQQGDYELLVQEVKKDFLEKTEKVFNPSFEGFKFKTGNEKTGFDEIVYKPENVVEAKNWHSDMNNLNQKFFDQNGKVINNDYYTIAEIARIGVDKFVNHVTNTALANKAIQDDKLSKNIPTAIRPVSTPNSPGGGISVRVIEQK